MVLPAPIAYGQFLDPVAPAGHAAPWVASDRAGLQTWNKVNSNFVILNTFFKSGTGSPEGVVTAGVGAVYLRTDGSAGTVLYCKNSGTGNTGWGSCVASSGTVTVTGTPVTGDITSFSSSTSITNIASTGTGNVVRASSPTIATPTFTGALVFPDGVRQTFNPDGTNAGLNVGSQAGDPSAPSNGDLWYDSTANELTARINGSSVALGAGGGSGTPAGSSGDWQKNSSGSFGAFTPGTGVETFVVTPSSANLRGALTDETGTGAAVFATSPTFTTPNIGTATGSISGNAGTATALAANGSNCSAGNYPLGVDASGNVESCTAIGGGGGGSLTDGDYGDITVGGTGTTLTIDNDAVTYAKMQNVSAASKLLGRGDSGSGDTQEITLGTGLTMSGTTLSASGGGGGGTIYWEQPAGLRLSLSTNTYVPASDITGATTIYWTPMNSGGHGTVTCYNGTTLEQQSIAQKSIALGTLTNGAIYNVYYDCDGAALAFGTAWTNSTTASETLDDQDGAPVLSTDHTKLYLGIFRTTSTTTTEDSQTKRFLWNMFNRRLRTLVRVDTADTWSSGTAATYRQAGANAANQIEIVVANTADLIQLQVNGGFFSSASTYPRVGIGVNSTTVNSAQTYHQMTSSNNYTIALDAQYVGIPTNGYSYFAWLDYIDTGSGTFHGDCDSGCLGTVAKQSVSGMTGTFTN